MQQLITDRMVEMTFAPATDIAAWFTRLGLEALSAAIAVAALVGIFVYWVLRKRQ